MSGDNIYDYTPTENFDVNETERPEFPSVQELGNLTDQVKLANLIAANNEAIESVKGQYKKAFLALNSANQEQIIGGLPNHWLNDQANYPLYSHLLKV